MSSDKKQTAPETTSTRQQMSRNEAIETEMDPEVAVEKILAAGKAMDKLTLAAISFTDSRCWDNMQGSPRLNSYGAHLVAKKIGLRVRTFGSREIESGKDASGPYFIFQCTGEIGHPLTPAVVPIQGTCDSRNKFHTTRYEGSGRNRKRVQLQAHQVQRTFIAQQSQTLAITKGVASFLGLDRMTWDEVEKLSQARRKDSASVLFGDDDGPTDAQRKQKERHARQEAPKAPPPEQRDAPPADPADAPASGQQLTAVWRAYLDSRQIDASDLPPNAGEVFYAWVVDIVGEKYGDKKTWTVGVVDKLLEALEGPAPS